MSQTSYLYHSRNHDNMHSHTMNLVSILELLMISKEDQGRNATMMWAILMHLEEAYRVELCTLSSRSCVTPTEEAFTFCIVSKAYSSGLTYARNQPGSTETLCRSIPCNFRSHAPEKFQNSKRQCITSAVLVMHDFASISANCCTEVNNS